MRHTGDDAVHKIANEIALAESAENLCAGLIWYPPRYQKIDDILVQCPLKGVQNLLPKNNYHVLCSISTLSTSFWKMIYASWSKLSKELKKALKFG